MPHAATLTAGLLLACLVAPTQARDDGWRTAGWHACFAEHGDLMTAVDAAAPGARAAVDAATAVEGRRAAMHRIDQAIRQACAARIAGGAHDGIHVVEADVLAYAASASDAGLLKETDFSRFLALDASSDSHDTMLLSRDDVVALRDTLDDRLRRAHPQAYRASLMRLRDAFAALEARLSARTTASWVDVIATTREAR